MFTSPTRPENQLLVYIARRRLDEATVQQIRELLHRCALDWQYVSTTATAHAVGGLLAHHLLTIDCDLVPASVLRELQLDNQQHTQRCLALAGELTKITGALSAADIPSITFKGPTLALMAYENLGLRQFADLDILIRARDFQRAKQALAERGFAAVTPLDRGGEAALLRFDNAWGFQNEHEVFLDLHWRFAPLYFSLKLETEDLWQRLEPVDIGSQTVLTLSPEDLLIVLCCHGFTHEWERLVWVCDIASLIEQRKNLDWDYLFREAKQSGVLRIVLVGLVLASELGARLPLQVRERLERDHEIAGLLHKLSEHILEPQESQAGLRESVMLQLRMRERTRDKIKTLVRLVFTPRHYDWRFASLPPSLWLLYYVIRPIRMARTYGARLLNSSSRTKTARDM
jgi:hypothetical protein